MIIANAKRKENICEYLLYMWQVEDLIRAAGCDEEGVDRLVLTRYDATEHDIQAIRQWYYELVCMMRQEGKQTQGHLDVNRVVMMELEALHREALACADDVLYQGLHYQILPAIIQLRAKSGVADISDLEVCFNAIYGYLTLSLKGQTVGDDTLKSIKQISSFLSVLALKYNQQREMQ